MKKMVVGDRIKPKPPLIMELVGPAGAGKTTLSRALSQRDERILVGTDLEIRKIQHLPIFASHVPLLLPVWLRRRQSGRWFTWDEIKIMAYLKAWPDVLRQPASNHGRVILLDQGPVFKLATLNAFGPERVKDQAFEQWWHSMFKQWAFTLDIVICLNAPAKILIQRINARSKRHEVKDKPDLEAHQYLARYQMSYEQILGKLTTNGRPALFQFDTSERRIEQVVDEVLLKLTSHIEETERAADLYPDR